MRMANGNDEWTDDKDIPLALRYYIMAERRESTKEILDIIDQRLEPVISRQEEQQALINKIKGAAWLVGTGGALFIVKMLLEIFQLTVKH